MNHSLAVQCGQLLVTGLEGHELSTHEKTALVAGQRGGVIIFKRNIRDLRQLASLNQEVMDAVPNDFPALVSVDQEGGRFVNVPPPAMALPPMAMIGALDDDTFTMRIAEAQAFELAALGFGMSFAPVADVNTRPENPIIGNRAFSRESIRAYRHAAAWARGLAKGGLLSCAKHFPGHGDTTADSHLSLPRVERAREKLNAAELVTFRGLTTVVPSMMTAHVVYDGLDPGVPATLSRRVCHDLLRDEFRFKGVLFSDCMEMKAIKAPFAEAAVAAVVAGCDILLYTQTRAAGEEAHEGLVREAEKSEAFRARVSEALERGLAMRRSVGKRKVASAEEWTRIHDANAPIEAELRDKLGAY